MRDQVNFRFSNANFRSKFKLDWIYGIYMMLIGYKNEKK